MIGAGTLLLGGTMMSGANHAPDNHKTNHNTTCSTRDSMPRSTLLLNPPSDQPKGCMASSSVPLSSCSNALSNHGLRRLLAVAWSILGSFNLRICSSRVCKGLVVSEISLPRFLDWSLQGEGVERLRGEDILQIWACTVLRSSSTVSNMMNCRT